MNRIPHPDYVCDFNDEPGNYSLVWCPVGSLLGVIKGEVFSDRESFEVALHKAATHKDDHNYKMTTFFDPKCNQTVTELAFADYCERCRAEKNAA